MKYGPILIICAALLWALDGVIRRSLYTLPPITIVFFEHFIGLLVLLPFIWRSLLGEKLTKKEWIVMTLIALFSGVLGTLFFTTALLEVHFISFSVVFLLQKLQPIFAIGSARILLKEKINKAYVPWALLALVAAFFVTFKNGSVNFATGSGTIVAALYALGAAIVWGSSTALSKMVLNKRSPIYITGLRFLITTVLALALVFIMGKSSTLGALTLSQGARVLLITCSTGMVALLIYYRGLKYTPVRVSTILELMFPVVAIIIDMFLYHTVLAPTQWIAAAVLLFAMYKVTKVSQNEIHEPIN